MADPDNRSASETPEPSRLSDRDGEGVITEVVAGTGFEPVTFRL
jgi:hypothetical protein